MKIVYLRPGEFRMCPRCSARQKGLQRKCDQCGASLEDAQIAARAYVPTPGPHPLRSDRGLRVVLTLAVIGATLIGLVVRNTFSGAALDEPRAASENVARAQARAEVAGPDPSVYERNAPVVTATAGAPEGWHQLATRSLPPPPTSASLGTIVEQGAYTVDPAAVGGMVGITPGSSGLGRRLRPGTTFTNDDLATIRTASVTPPLAPPAPTLDDRALVDQQRRRDAENDLRSAQSRLEVLRTEADILRRDGARVTDPSLQEAHQRRLKSLLDDLEDAEKDLAKAERKLRES
jgi:hypothetical protein